MIQELFRVQGCRFCAAGIGALLGFAVATQPAVAWPGDTQKKEGKAPLPGKQSSLNSVTFVAFDTETTGFSPENERVVEIGVVKFKDGDILERKSWLVNPGRKIPPHARRVHGISDEMVANQPTFKEAYPNFEAFIEGSVLLAHNARFDISFIREETRRNDLTPPANEVIDSLTLFRRWFPDSESHSLEGLAKYLKLGTNGLHRAVADSMVIYQILSEGKGKHPATRTLGDLQQSAGGVRKF